MRGRSRVVLWFEEAVAFASTAIIVLVPFLDKVIQKVFANSGGIPGSNVFVSYSVIALCFSASILTTREGKHLNVGLLADNLKGGFKDAVVAFNTVVSVVVTLVYLSSSLAFLFTGIPADKRVGLVPERLLVAIMPLAFLIMAVYFMTQAKISRKHKIAASAIAYPLGLMIGFPALMEFLSAKDIAAPAFLEGINAAFQAGYPAFHVVWVVVLIAGAVAGTPIFILLGGLAYTFFTRDMIPISALPTEPLLMLRGDMIPALPLFTVTGYILSESSAGKRLIEVFKNLVGWIPGGMIIVSVLVCTFFTTFTGASGITILALGGILAFILKESGGYDEGFTHGLLTASGSIGIMLPPSLAVIMYAVINGGIDIRDLFMGTFLPGLLLVVGMSAAGIVISIKKKTPTFPFKLRTAGDSLLEAIWELLLPVGIVSAYFLGWATIPEAASFSLVYVIVTEVLVKREIPARKLPGIILKALSVVGGTLIILMAARDLSLYIVYIDLPTAITSWISSFVTSKFVFLLLLNLLLLVVGCFLDIFSAIMVVAPLLFPLGNHFGIHPIHLASIFLVNLCIGYLTPPVGMNLFLASYTFERPLTRIYRNILPFLLIQIGILAVVTYVPWLSVNSLFSSIGGAFTKATMGPLAGTIALSALAALSTAGIVLLGLRYFNGRGRTIVFVGLAVESLILLLFALKALPLVAVLALPILSAAAGGLIERKSRGSISRGLSLGFATNVFGIACLSGGGSPACVGPSGDAKAGRIEGISMLLFILSGMWMGFLVSSVLRIVSIAG
jgi:C4-dicarboxylate transporter, DctM subunit